MQTPPTTTLSDGHNLITTADVALNIAMFCTYIFVAKVVIAIHDILKEFNPMTTPANQDGSYNRNYFNIWTLWEIH